MAERNRNKTQEDKATVADDEAIELPKDEKCTEGDDANNSDNGNTDEPDTDWAKSNKRGIIDEFLKDFMYFTNF